MLHPTNIPRLTFANVVSVIALFVALGGGAYAVSSAGKNSVVSKSIKNGQVKTKDLANNAVNGAKVGDDSLTGDDVAESTLGQVASAASANHASSADSATSASHATDADTATNANHAASADSANHATSADSATSAGNGARMFDFDHPANDPNPVSILSVGEMSLRAQCHLFPPTLDFSVVSTTNADVSWGWLDELDHAGPAPHTDSLNLIPGTPEILVQIAGNGGGATSTRRAEGQLVYHNANRVITVTFHAAAHNDFGTPANNRCQVRGTALAAPG